MPSEKELRYRTPYFGKQKWDEIPEEVQAIISAAPEYADFTMGGAEVPFLQAARGATVYGNDRCYYAFCAAHAGMANDFEGMTTAKMHDLINVMPHPGGYIATYVPIAVPNIVKQYADTLLTMYAHNLAWRGVVGRTIARIWTDKRRRWLDVPEVGLTIAEFQGEVLKDAIACQAYTSIIDAARGGVYLTNTDALSAIHATTPQTNEAVAYVDPAWPWAEEFVKSEGENPYLFVTYELSAAVAQKRIPEIPYFWRTGDRGAAQLIMDDVLGWVQEAFDRGWSKFIVSTQSTNFPNPGWVQTILGRTFGNATMYGKETIGGNDLIPYTDYFIVVNNPRM